MGGGKQRALLARLLLERGRVVSTARLVHDLWGDSAPGTAPKMVQVYVSQLRKALPPGVLQTRAPGYLVDPTAARVDLDRFESLLDDGRSRLRTGDAAGAAGRLREAERLWRGSALAEFEEPFAAPEAARLEELLLECVEERVEAELALGLGGEIVSELEALVQRHPFRERLLGQLLRALYGAGRQADALAAYRVFRERLAEELGMEPTRELKELERRILRQDPTLEAPPPVATASEPPLPVPQEIRHARSGDVRIAYQVVGDGPIDIVLVHGWVCTFQPGWEDARIARFYRRLASMGRLILFDKRGIGLSDRVSADEPPDLETRMDDVRAVMDAAGSERAVVIGVSEGGPMSILFGATHPDRTAALVLVGTFARYTWAPDYPIGQTEGELARRTAAAEADDWARATTLEWLRRVAPDVLADEERFSWYVSYVIRGASPAGNRALRTMNVQIDVRDVLPAVAVPTLVMYREGEWYREGSRHLAAHLPAARVEELPGVEHLPWEGNQEALLDAIEAFVASLSEQFEPDRVLVTVLVADFVASPVEPHHAIVRAQLARFRGREVDAGSDGLLAVFDGPARAVRCAAAITRALEAVGVDFRAGVHTGEVELVDGAVRGPAVDVGRRVAAEAGAGEVLVSQTVRDLVVGSGLEFDDRGMRTLGGVEGEWRLLAVKQTRAGGAG